MVVEDDEVVLRWVVKILDTDGFQVSAVSTGVSAIELLEHETFDLAIVDLGLPDMKGNDIVRYARTNNRAASILVLSGYTDDSEVVDGLNAGADDFVAKPVASKVLSARIRAVLRRYTMPDHVRVGNTKLDRLSRTLIGDLGEVALTAKEFGILEMLMAHHGQVVSRESMLSELWGFDFDPGTSMLDVALTRVRQKMKSVSTSVQVCSVRNLGVVLKKV